MEANSSEEKLMEQVEKRVVGLSGDMMLLAIGLKCLGFKKNMTDEERGQLAFLKKKLIRELELSKSKVIEIFDTEV